MKQEIIQTVFLAIFFAGVIWYFFVMEFKNRELEKQIQYWRNKNKKNCRNCGKLRIEVHNNGDSQTSRFACNDDYHEVKLTDACKEFEEKIK